MPRAPSHQASTDLNGKTRPLAVAVGAQMGVEPKSDDARLVSMLTSMLGVNCIIDNNGTYLSANSTFNGSTRIDD